MHDRLYACVEAVSAREWERRVWVRLPGAVVPPTAIRQDELWPLGSVLEEHACLHGQGHYQIVCAWLTARGDAEDGPGPRVSGDPVGVRSPRLGLPEWSGHHAEAVP